MLRMPPSGEKPRSSRQDLRLSAVEGTSYCVMAGVGQEYFVAFALVIGLGEVGSGLVATLPVFIGATAQLAAPWLIRRAGSLRRYMIFASALQAACFAPLIAGALYGTLPAAALYLTVAAYSAINLGQGPAWNTWITTLVPRRIRAKYFAERSRMLQGGVLAGLLIGGLLLDKNQAGEDGVQTPTAFAMLFSIALIMRVIGCYLISRQSEPVALPARFRHVGPRELLGRARHGADVTLLTFLLATNLAHQIALPFFTPFVLEHRGLTYLEFTTLTGAVIVGKMVAAPTVGRLAHRAGPKRILWIGAIGVIPMAPLWLAADSYATLLIVQFCMGPLLSCFDIGALLMQYENIEEHERASVISSFTAINALGGFAGSLIGGALLFWIDSPPSAYLAVFLIGSVARLIALPLLLRVKTPKAVAEPIPSGIVRLEPGVGTTSLSAVDPEDRP